MQFVSVVLDEFGKAYGLRVSVAKSKVVCSHGVPASVRRSFRDVCPIPLAHDLGRYLGFPLNSGRASHDRFKFLLDQVSRRLGSWKSRLLNTTGRICLDKSVLAAIPTYTMQVVWLPRKIIYFLNKVTQSFIWSKNDGIKGWHRVNWETLVLPK